MSTAIYGINPTSAPIPGPNFYWARGADGNCTGRHTFTVTRGAMAQEVNQVRFLKGTPITSLDTTLPAFFSFLTIEEVDANDVPGGFTEVSVTLSGFTTAWFDTDREVIYSSDSTLVERCILENENFLEQVAVTERGAIAQVYNGFAHGQETFAAEELSSVTIYNNATDEEILIMTDVDALAWYKLIFIEGNRTFLAPHYEWQKSTANAGGLTNAELAKLGKIDTNPGGSPPEPPGDEEDGYSWLKVRASDSRTNGSASTDESWQWGKWPEKIYSTTP